MEAFEKLNASRGRGPNEPFFVPKMGADVPLAIQSLVKAQDADAQDNVLFIFAHDMTIAGTVDLFPLEANDWKKKGWREKIMWKFLEDLTPALGSVSTEAS